jgi:hypothetical protein
MQAFSVLKIVAAFVVGIVVALGGALLYVRVNDSPRSVPVTRAAVTQPPAAAPVPTPADDDRKLATAPSDVSSDEPAQAPVRSTTPHIRHVPVVNASRHFAPALRTNPAPPVQTAQIQEPQVAPSPTASTVHDQPPLVMPPPPPVTAPANRTTAVNENAAASGAHVGQTPEPAAPPQPHVVTLQQGQILSVRLGETLSTDHNYTGDTFRGTLAEPIVIDGFIIADRGSKVLGRIVDAQRAGRGEGNADLSVTVTEINTTDNQRIAVQTSAVDKRSGSARSDDAAKVAGGAALGAIIGAIAGGGRGAAIGAGAGGAAGGGWAAGTHGKQAVIPTETKLTFRLENPVTITEHLNN